MNQKKKSALIALTVVCGLMSVWRYYQDGDVPLLQLFLGKHIVHRMQQSKQCECTCSMESLSGVVKKENSTPKAIPYVAPGPSKVQELVPLKKLKTSVSLSEYEGLVHLDHTSLSHYFQCQPSKTPVDYKAVKQCQTRRFLDGKGPLTAIVSFHGSGNTWVRYLIEQVTGIFTGSIYCDPVLRKMFPGEFVASSNVIVVKTHHADTTDLPKDVQLEVNKQKYDRAIVLVRDPFDALVSEANRRWNSNRTVNNHVGLAGETAFISNSKWDWLVEYKGAAWAFLLHTWLAQSVVPVHVVQYERLVSNLREELVKIAKFLEVEVTESDVDCAVENGEGPFKRAKHLNFDPYSSTNKEAMNRCIQQATPLLAKYSIHYNHR